MRKRRVEVLDVENVEKSIRVSILCFIVANDYPLFAFRICFQYLPICNPKILS